MGKMEKDLAATFDFFDLAKNSGIDCHVKYQANGAENCRSKADAIQGHSRSALEMKGRALL
jgi:hypothetical protein